MAAYIFMNVRTYDTDVDGSRVEKEVTYVDDEGTWCMWRELANRGKPYSVVRQTLQEMGYADAKSFMRAMKKRFKMDFVQCPDGLLRSL